MDVSTNERLNKLNKYVENKKARAEEEEQNRIIILNDLALKIKDLKPRIESLIVLHDKCMEIGIEIPRDKNHMVGCCGYIPSAKKYGYNADFIAEGIYHHVGFFEDSDGITRLGIENGGACGYYDLVVDEFGGVFGRLENSRHIVNITRKEYTRSERDMRKFLKEFPVFEKAFLAWIDTLIDTLN